MTYDELYSLAISNGCAPSLADMLASRKFPGTKGTDRSFMQGRKLDGSQFEGIPLVGNHHLCVAQKAGVNPAGKYYSGPLARYPGDPEAWVDSVHDVKRICEKRGWECEGAIKVESPRYSGTEPGPYRVADDIVDDHLSHVLSERPELVPKAGEVRDEIQGRLSGIHG